MIAARRPLRPLLVAIFFFFLASASVRAQAGQGGASEPAYPVFDQLGASVGWYDFIKDEDQAADFRIEYRASVNHNGIRPWVGLESTSDGAVYLVGGLLRDIFLTRRFILTPSFGAGYYHDGAGKNLGSTLEFRLQADFAYELDDGARIALSFSHLSNARLGGNNPGAEILSLTYLVPLEQLF